MLRTILMNAVLSNFSFQDVDNSKISPLSRDTVEIEETADGAYLVTLTIESGNLPSFSDYNDGNFTGQNITSLQYRRSSSDYEIPGYHGLRQPGNRRPQVSDGDAGAAPGPPAGVCDGFGDPASHRMSEGGRVYAHPLCSGEVRTWNATIAVAEALTEWRDYTAETWAALVDALEKARTVAADETATQTQVDDAATGLAAAIQALVEKVTHYTMSAVLSNFGFQDVDNSKISPLSRTPSKLRKRRTAPIW